ncbi:hypothetical protein TVAG_194470 [Trichomonas vaginalis G3]|uniref:Uncharacterized protein n=1 Tax=Trichomonas vaginalis (strain ATCC PRA-98 / G3) TaxID=412133 RepID=A2ESB8_TRIV3|nr:hypothetical protein TVAGG3_0715750 [Trichomonas vaginalis G3]EAY04482.1 hypothetical protein TVAG_194470 [Trichomonas vaginalis G3]KAI5510237.1 hypothetical protein TVAGG3_0715750 [Trichomonas vaginalis G3]|eukprot:XP_001316705.1 hypothetical protein [Trichomonas vaginalis G3]
MNLETPLSMAARCNDIKFVQFLLERGAKEFLTNPDRPRYPIFQCSNYQNFELLRDKWFDPNVVYPERQSPFAMLFSYSDEKTINFMIQQKVKPIQRDIHFAANNGNLSCLKYFVDECGLKLNKETLQIALSKGQTEMVDYIISKGIHCDPANIPKHKIEEIKKIYEKYNLKFEFSEYETNRYCIKYAIASNPEFKLSERNFAESFDDLLCYYQNGVRTCKRIRCANYELIDDMNSLL